jgi:hypothetical protein
MLGAGIVHKNVSIFFFFSFLTICTIEAKIYLLASMNFSPYILNLMPDLGYIKLF